MIGLRRFATLGVKLRAGYGDAMRMASENRRFAFVGHVFYVPWAVGT